MSDSPDTPPLLPPEREARRRTLPYLLAAWLATCFFLIYAGDVGKGFISDDFGWILQSRVSSPREVARFFLDPPAFYRPLVALSFAVNQGLSGLNPAPYGWTNVGLSLAVSGGIVWLARGLGFSFPAGLFAAALWAFNVHSIRMALLWISGRTSLLTALFAVAAAVAFTRKRFVLTGGFTLAALLSKEEPVMLPAIFALWAAIDARAGGERRMRGLAPRVWRAGWPSFLALGIYAVMRGRTEAWTLATAPPPYRLTLSPDILATNVFSYLDRSLTLTLGVLLLSWILFVRSRVRLDRIELAAVLKGCVWLILGFAVTVMLPVRSGLYVCFPAVGASLIGLGLGTPLWRAMTRPRRTVAAAALLILPLALVPVHRARNVRVKQEAQLSARVTERIRTEFAARPALRQVIIYDNPDRRPNIDTVLGPSLIEAVELFAGRPVSIQLISRPPARVTTTRRDPTTLTIVHGYD